MTKSGTDPYPLWRLVYIVQPNFRSVEVLGRHCKFLPDLDVLFFHNFLNMLHVIHTGSDLIDIGALAVFFAHRPVFSFLDRVELSIKASNSIKGIKERQVFSFCLWQPSYNSKFPAVWPNRSFSVSTGVSGSNALKAWWKAFLTRIRCFLEVPSLSYMEKVDNGM